MQQEIISVIVPVYNVSEYLPRCLDSILNQTYTNLEILLVNDGSTDNSGFVCDEYAKKDSRIRVFHKENGGVSSARNVGLTHRTGRYVGSVDADDWISPNMYSLLFQKLRENPNASVGVANYFKNTHDKQIPIANLVPISSEIISAKDMMIYALNRDFFMGFCSYSWNKLFVLDKTISIRYDEQVKFGEDVLFFANLIISGDCRGVYVDKPLYHYFQRPESLAGIASIDHRIQIIAVYKRIEKLLNEYGHSDIAFLARGFCCYHASMAAEKSLEEGDYKTFTLMQSEIKTYLEDYIETNENFPEKLEKVYHLLRMDVDGLYL